MLPNLLTHAFRPGFDLKNAPKSPKFSEIPRCQWVLNISRQQPKELRVFVRKTHI